MTETILKIDLAEFGNIFRRDPARLEDQELLALDFLLHRAWRHKRDGGRVHFGDRSWSFEDLINLHALAKREMSKRGFKHPLRDELDQQTEPFLREAGVAKQDLAPVYPSGLNLGRPITLDEVLPQVRSFYVHPVFAWIVGGLANWGRTRGDVDVLWWASEELPEYLRKILEFRFGRQFKDRELAARVQHHLNVFQGPFTKAVPIYALKIERINPEGEVKAAEWHPEAGTVDLVWDDTRKGWTIPAGWPELQAAGAPAAEQEGAAGPVQPDKEARANHVLQEKEIAEGGETVFKLIDEEGEDEIEKGSPFSVFGRFTGRVLRGVLKAMPGHKVYVEPFCGPAQFLHTKDPSELEVIADKDPAIVALHKTIRDLTPSDFKRLEGFRWGKLSKESFKELTGKKFSDPVRELWRVIVLKRNSIGGGVDFTKRTHYRNEPIADFGSRALHRLRRANERLRKVKIRQADFERTMREWDGKDAFFIIDPPYFERDEYYGVGFTRDDLKRLCRTLRSVKGKFILLHTPAGDFDLEGELKGFHCHRFRWETPIGHMSRDGKLNVEKRRLLAFWNFGGSDLVKSLEPLEKGLYFSAMGGLKPYRGKILPLPEHRTYVEAFCGCGEMIWEKEPSEREILADIDPEIVFLHRFCKRMSQADIDRLTRKNWTGEKERYERLKRLEPRDAVERFYKNLYMRTFARQTTVWHKDTFRTTDAGRTYSFGRVLRARGRLKNVNIERSDWWDTVRKYDAKDTLFFLDPPYEGCEKYYPHGVVDYADMARRLKGIKGKFIFVVKLRPATLAHFKGFNIERFFWRNRFAQISDHVRTKSIAYVIRNFHQVVRKDAAELAEPDPIEKQAPIYNLNPAEDRTYRYVIQAHWRGRTVHHDFRIESADKEFLIGWTLATMIEAVVKEPVETMSAAREWSRSGEAYKIDFTKGEFKERRTRAGNIVRAQLRAFPKAKEPHVWLEVEGVTPPFPAPGATKQYRGVFLIDDEGVAEYGAQKIDAYEYFLHGKLKGRLLIRRLVREELKELAGNELAKVLPPGEEEGEAVTATFWTAIQPEDQTPVALSDHEVKKKWVPPHGVSAASRFLEKFV